MTANFNQPLQIMWDYDRLLREYENAATRAHQVYPTDLKAAEEMARGMRQVIGIELVQLRRQIRALGMAGGRWPLPPELSHISELNECGICCCQILDAFRQGTFGGMQGFLLDPCAHLAWISDVEVAELGSWESNLFGLLEQCRREGGRERWEAGRGSVKANWVARFLRHLADARRRGLVRWGDRREVYVSETELVKSRNAAFLAESGTPA